MTKKVNLGELSMRQLDFEQGRLGYRPDSIHSGEFEPRDPGANTLYKISKVLKVQAALLFFPDWDFWTNSLLLH